MLPNYQSHQLKEYRFKIGIQEQILWLDKLPEEIDLKAIPEQLKVPDKLIQKAGIYYLARALALSEKNVFKQIELEQKNLESKSDNDELAKKLKRFKLAFKMFHEIGSFANQHYEDNVKFYNKDASVAEIRAFAGFNNEITEQLEKIRKLIYACLEEQVRREFAIDSVKLPLTPLINELIKKLVAKKYFILLNSDEIHDTSISKKAIKLIQIKVQIERLNVAIKRRLAELRPKKIEEYFKPVKVDDIPDYFALHGDKKFIIHLTPLELPKDKSDFVKLAEKIEKGEKPVEFPKEFANKLRDAAQICLSPFSFIVQIGEENKAKAQQKAQKDLQPSLEPSRQSPNTN